MSHRCMKNPLASIRKDVIQNRTKIDWKEIKFGMEKKEEEIKDKTKERDRQRETAKA